MTDGSSDSENAPREGDAGTTPPGGDAGAAPRAVDAPAAPPEARELEGRLETLRARLEELDGELIRLVGQRRDTVLEVGRVKGAMGRPVLDPVREARVVRRAAERAREAGVDEELVRDVIWRIMASARDAQTGRTGWGPPEPPTEAAPEPDDRS